VFHSSSRSRRTAGNRLIQIKAVTRLPPKVAHGKGFPKSKLPRSPLSFSAWLCSPSSCWPLDERGLRRPQRVKVRRPVVAGDRLAVDQERLRPDAERSINDGREAVGPVMAVAGEAADARAIPAHHQPIAVVLDLVNPERAGRWLGHLRRQARFDETGRTATIMGGG
jgi:hypothetical protein